MLHTERRGRDTRSGNVVVPPARPCSDQHLGRPTGTACSRHRARESLSELSDMCTRDAYRSTTAGAARSERPTSGQGSKRSGGRRVTDTAWQALASGERQGQRTGATAEEKGGAACRQRAHRVSKMVSCASSCGATASCWAHAIITRSARSAGPSSSTQCSGKAPTVGRFWRRHSSVDHGWQRARGVIVRALIWPGWAPCRLRAPGGSAR